MSSGIALPVFREGEENWSSYKERLECYFTVKDVKDERKVHHLIVGLQPKPYQILKDLVAPDTPVRMDNLRFPEFINENNFGVDGLSYPREEEIEESPWGKTKSWLLWLTQVEIYLMLAAMVLLTVYALYLRYANKSSMVYCTSNANMKGKTALITANPTGIGLAAARDLAQRGARVILACTDVRDAQEMAAVLDIMNKSGGTIVIQKLNTSSLKEITEFADNILKTEKRLDVLMLTANVGGSDTKTLTNDEDLELTMATNHFGHFLLVNHLIGLLKTSAPSRVVVMASSAHYLLSSVNPKDLNFESVEYGALRAYAQSMACNLLMANNLAYQMDQSGVTVNSMCPGMMTSQAYLTGGGFITRLYLILLNIASRSAEEGAQTLIHLAVSEDVANCTGAFFTDCAERSMTLIGKDVGLAKKTWERCEEIVGLNVK